MNKIIVLLAGLSLTVTACGSGEQARALAAADKGVSLARTWPSAGPVGLSCGCRFVGTGREPGSTSTVL
jgi:hypothetical protein